MAKFEQISNDDHQMSLAGDQDQGGFHNRLNSLFAPIHKICMIKLYVNRGQKRVLNGNTTDLDWSYSRPIRKQKSLFV